MTMTRPCLLMILHFSQIFLTDGFTFIVLPCLSHRLCAVCGWRLFRAPGDPSLCQVIYGYFNRYLVAGKNLDIVHAKLTRDMSRNDMPIGKLNLEYGVRQCLNNRTLEFYNVVLRQNNPSLMDST